MSRHRRRRSRGAAIPTTQSDPFQTLLQGDFVRVIRPDLVPAGAEETGMIRNARRGQPIEIVLPGQHDRTSLFSVLVYDVAASIVRVDEIAMRASIATARIA